jgi:paraquat-inducible protein B
VKQHASTALIGGFVLGAIALTILGVLLFGAGNYFVEPTRYVMYFSGSVNGLDIGAPVKFRGVKVGSVSSIELQIDPKDREMHIPVLVDLSPKLVRIFQDREDLDGELFLDEMMRRGLRAQLKEQSLVTGKLMIELEYHPDSPLVLTGNYDDLREIPSIPSDFEQISQELQKGLVVLKQIPLEEVFVRLLSTLEGIDGLVRSEEFIGGIRAARGAAKELRQLAATTRSQVEPLSSSLDATLGELRVTLAQVRTLSGNLDRELPIVSGRLQAALQRAYAAAEQAEGAFASMNNTLSRDSPLLYKLDRALDELTAAVRSLRLTADYLQQNPSSVIFGKGGYGQR